MTAPGEDVGLHDVFTAELLDRVTWFVRERWLAGAGLVAVALLAPLVGLPASWGRIWLVAALVLGYNLFFARVIAVRTRLNRVDYQWLARCTLFQIILDLAALLVLILLTGGVSSPFGAFFVFHMVIGTIMLSARTMLLVAGAVWTVFTTAFVAFPRLAGGAVVALPPPATLVEAVVLGFTLGLTVFLTDTVASRFKERGVQLFRLTRELRHKTAELEALLGTLRAVEERKSRFMLLSAHQLRSPWGPCAPAWTSSARGTWTHAPSAAAGSSTALAKGWTASSPSSTTSSSSPRPRRAATVRPGRPTST